MAVNDEATVKPPFKGERVRLGEVCKIVHGKNQRAVENPKGKYPIYGSGGLMSRADDYICPANTTIVGRKGTINRPIFVSEPFWNVDTAFGLVANQTYLLPRYLFHFCTHFNFEDLSTTSAIPSLTSKNIERIQLTLPSLQQQSNRVALLDSCLKQISLCQAAVDKLDLLVKSRFNEMFGDQGRASSSIRNIAKTCSGGTPSSKNPDYYDGGTIPWLTSGEINQDCILSTSKRITEAGLRDSSAKWIPENSVVIAMYGATAGKSGLLRIPCTTNQAVCSILPTPHLNPLFLLHAVRSKEDWMVNQAAGGAQPNISQTIINRMHIPIASKSEQEQFSSFVSQVGKLRFKVQQQIEHLEQVKKSLMQEYFG